MGDRLLNVLRGDFFAFPFGQNSRGSEGREFPYHGESAQGTWHLEQNSRNSLHVSLELTACPGRIDKFVSLNDGDDVIYQRHVITGVSGRYPVGHHTMLRLPDITQSGIVSVSPFDFGQVYPAAFEDGIHGFQSLEPGAVFGALERVALRDGGTADLAKFPDRRGFDDLVMVATEGTQTARWAAVVVPEEHYVWFAICDGRILNNTVLWMSNGGRRYEPWNGRHVNVLGIEFTTSYFHEGVGPSAAPNPVNERGFPTAHALVDGEPFVVNYIMGAVETPAGFCKVAVVEANCGGGQIDIVDEHGVRVRVRADADFIYGPCG